MVYYYGVSCTNSSVRCKSMPYQFLQLSKDIKYSQEHNECMRQPYDRQQPVNIAQYLLHCCVQTDKTWRICGRYFALLLCKGNDYALTKHNPTLQQLQCYYHKIRWTLAFECRRPLWWSGYNRTDATTALQGWTLWAVFLSNSNIEILNGLQTQF